MKKFLYSFGLASALILANAPQADAARIPELKVYDLQVDVDETRNTVDISLDLHARAFELSRDREVIYTPVIIALDDSDELELDPVIIAGRNRWYYYMREGALDQPGHNIYRANTDVHARYSTTVPFEPWMGHCTIEMRQQTANCCATPETVPGDSDKGNVLMASIDTERPALAAPFIFAPPVDAGPVIKNIEGSAFITFVVNRTELKPDYMVNRRELQKIISSIDFVRRDSDATITRVHIKGFASPEGPYDNNVRLAKGRTETLRRYVRDLYSFPDTTVTQSYEPEDWAGLRSYLTDSMNFDIKHRAEIIDIVDGPLGFDNKDLAIKTRFPEDYAVILKQIYPWLRHSDYRVTYSIRTYTSLEEIRRVFAADPTKLRNVDFYTLAQSYPEGSPEYMEVFATAVEVYPDDPMLNLNAANIELERGDLDAAQSHLLKAGSSPIADYARGVLAARRKDWKEAVRRFTSARDGGIEQAQQCIDMAESIRDYHPVSYHITTTLKEAQDEAKAKAEAGSK